MAVTCYRPASATEVPLNFMMTFTEAAMHQFGVQMATPAALES
jgi:hypothetical protein